MKALKDYTLGEAQEICLRCGLDHIDKKTGERCRFWRDLDVCRLKYIPGICSLKEKKVFTTDQIAVMREYYNAGYLFIARDFSDGPLPGNLYVSDVIPKKEHGIWKSGGNICKVPRKMFPQLTWDDEEATRFTDYINVEDAQ